MLDSKDRNYCYTIQENPKKKATVSNNMIATDLTYLYQSLSITFCEFIIKADYEGMHNFILGLKNNPKEVIKKHDITLGKGMGISIKDLVNTKYKGKTAINLAIWYFGYQNSEFFAAIKLLVSVEGNINGKNDDGRTALHLCVDRHYLEGDDGAFGRQWYYDDHDSVLMERMGFLLRLGCDPSAPYPNLDITKAWEFSGKMQTMPYYYKSPEGLPQIYPIPSLKHEDLSDLSTTFRGFTALQCLQAIINHNLSVNPFNIRRFADHYPQKVDEEWLKNYRESRKEVLPLRPKERRVEQQSCCVIA